MKRTLFKKQIPTLLGLFILFIGAGAGVILVGNGVDFLPRAAPEFEPKSVQITNVTDRSFSVSWLTDDATVGFIRYGTGSSLTTTIADDRDQLSGDTGSFVAHHVTIRGLSPNTAYSFKVGSGSDVYDNQGANYQAKTGPSLATQAESETIYGKVVTQAQTPAEGTIVYVTLDGGASLSTLVKSSGSWAVSLSSMRSADLAKYLSYDPDNAIIDIKVLGSDGQIYSGVTDTSTDQPVPTIVLGENFDFTNQGGAASADEEGEEDESAFNLEDLGEEVEDTGEVKLLNPSFNGEAINSTKPEIQGSAPPDLEISITVESPVTYQDEVVVDSSGEFAWSPPEDLEPGNHTITVSWVDPVSGLKQFFQRNFVVLAQGESNIPALTSTPSATPVTQTTPTPTPKPTATPTPKPTATPVPTATATPIPRSSQPASASSTPVAGSALQTIILLISGGAFVTTGFFLGKRFEDQ